MRTSPTRQSFDRPAFCGLYRCARHVGSARPEWLACPALICLGFRGTSCSAAAIGR